MTVGSKLDLKIANIDGKNRNIQLSLRSKDDSLEDNFQVSAKLGDILKEHLNNNSQED